MGEPSNRLLFGFHSIIAVSGPPIWNLFELEDSSPDIYNPKIFNWFLN